MIFDSDSAANRYIEEVCGGHAHELPDDFLTISSSDDNPDYPKWKFHPMYKYDQRGIKWVWQTGFDGVSIWNLFGPLTGTNITTTLVVLTRSSDTLSDQALIRCRKDALDKYRDGYLFPDDDRPRNVLPMKGKEYVPGKTKFATFPMIGDTKLDGIRAICEMIGNEVDMKSYKGVSLNHVQHIRDDMRDFMAFLPGSFTVDGEIYKHELKLREIQSLVSSNVNIKCGLNVLKFYMFDLADTTLVTEERHSTLMKAYNAYISVVGNNTCLRVTRKWYIYSYDDIMKSFNVSIEKGFEGIMIRHSSVGRKEGTKEWDECKYSFKKGASMYKLKKYTDAEGVVVGIAPAQGKEKDQCVLVIRTDFGTEFRLKFGSADEKRAWKKNPDLVLGRVLKYQYPDFNEATKLPIRSRGICFREKFA